MDATECLDFSEDCHGEVEYRMPLSGTGIPFPRCEFHWDLRLQEQERTNRLYGGDLPPRNFDPAYVGEHWDKDY